jgi:hypothetical protein
MPKLRQKFSKQGVSAFDRFEPSSCIGAYLQLRLALVRFCFWVPGLPPDHTDRPGRALSSGNDGGRRLLNPKLRTQNLVCFE